MKIGILTLPLFSNYGGILQCYALQTVLQCMGHEVQVLSKSQYGRSYYVIYPLAVCKRLLKRFLLGKDIAIFKAPHEVARQHTSHFIHTYIHQYYKRRWTSGIVSCFDVIVVGSDQVWRPEYSQPIEEAFLSFIGKSEIKRVAYAASFGVDYCEYTEEQLKICSPLLQKFDAVSVRESSGVSLCKKYFDVDAVQMLDPTLLLEADDYRKLIKRGNTHPSKGNLLLYILDKSEEKERLANKITADKGLIPFWLDSPEGRDDSLPLEKRVKMSVEQWLRSFDETEFVLTDSFHGCVFSILFRKPFIAIANLDRGLDRFFSLLNLFGLKDRLVFSYDEYVSRKAELLQPIDYSPVIQKHEQLRDECLTFLREALESNGVV